MNGVPPAMIAMSLISVFIAISIHEFAHAKTADMQGDHTPRIMGRVTLDPTKHFDPLGVIMIVVTSLTGYGIGWGKPVMTNPRNFKNPRWDSMWVAIAGPLSNFFQAAVALTILRFIPISDPLSGDFTLSSFLLIFGVINIQLMLFNLLPIGPLDGHWILGAFLPDGTRERWFLWNRVQGSFILLGLIIFSQIGNVSIFAMILEKPAFAIMKFLTGQ